ncbi:MAG: EI24 domain-containing protein [Desulfomonilaceae bacterium]
MNTTGGLAGRLLPAPFYVIRGALFLRAHRALWKYAAAPTAIGGLILGGSYWLLYRLLSRFFNTYAAGAWYQLVLYYLLLLGATVFLSVLFFFVLTRVASALAWPFNDLVSQKTEEIVRGTFQDTPFSILQLLKDSARSIGHSFKVLGIYLALLIAALLLLLIPGVGVLLYTGAGALISSYMFAYEYFGYPMDRRRFTWKQKQNFLRSRFRSVIGFGLGNLVVASIPVLNLLFIPVAVVGGTLLFLDLSVTPESGPGQTHGFDLTRAPGP